MPHAFRACGRQCSPLWRRSSREMQRRIRKLAGSASWSASLGFLCLNSLADPKVPIVCRRLCSCPFLGPIRNLGSAGPDQPLAPQAIDLAPAVSAASRARRKPQGFGLNRFLMRWPRHSAASTMPVADRRQRAIPKAWRQLRVAFILPSPVVYFLYHKLANSTTNY